MHSRKISARYKAIKTIIVILFSLIAITTAGTNIALHKPAYANGYYLDSKPEKAVDGDTLTAWNSGCHHPAWLEIDLKDNYNIDSINVNLAQTPDGMTAFQAWAFSEEDSMMVARWVGYTKNGSWLRKGFNEPLRNIDRIRICSENSPSWISFNEVAVIGVFGKRKKCGLEI
jgi:hypothetical protein